MAATDEDDRRFVKLFDSQTCSKSLAIPLGFNEYFPDPFRDYCGRCWTVRMKKRGAKVFLTIGWENFAKDNNLEDGKWLNIIYDCNRTFYVIVFGHGGCSEHRAFPQVLLDVSDYVTGEEDEEENISN